MTSRSDRQMPGDVGAFRVCPACGEQYPSTVRFCPTDGKVLREVHADNDPLIGALVGERYLVERLIGSGGMGVVYQAEHILMQRKCALKVLKPEMLSQPDSIARFSREARNSSRISHPNVATVYDFGTNKEETMYIAMEFVDGASLANVLKQEKTLSPERAAIIASQIALALDAAHALGIVHRDLKPDNVLLTRAEDGGELVKVIDFGIARAMTDAGQKVTSTSGVVGTPAYMSPEQLAGDVIDLRSDIYSLGLVCYSMLTGALPFGSAQSDLMLRFLQTPKSLAELNPSIVWPNKLQQVLTRVLAANPDERYQTATDFAIAFSNAVVPLLGGAHLEVKTARTISGGTPALSAILQSQSTAAIPKALLAPPRSKRRAVVGVAIAGTVFALVFAVLNFPRSSSGDPSMGVPPGSRPVSQPPETTATAPKSTTGQPAGAGRALSDSAVGQRSGAAGGQRSTPNAGRTVGAAGRSNNPTSVKADSSDSLKAAAASAAAAAAETKAAETKTDVVRDSSGSNRAAPVPNLTYGLVMLGSNGATLLVNGGSRGPLSSLGLQTVPLGDGVRLRLHRDNCQDWDTVVSVRPANIDTIRIGIRRPSCGNPRRE